MALARLAADGALEPEVIGVEWRTALTGDAFPPAERRLLYQRTC
jgi:hypothetical protein